MKTSELTGKALTFAVVTALGFNIPVVKTRAGAGFYMHVAAPDRPASWLRMDAQGYVLDLRRANFEDGNFVMDLIEREGISLFRYNKLDPTEPDKWGAHKVVAKPDWRGDPMNVALTLDGPTARIAVLRCFVSCKLGDEVDVPKELL